jgi:hypothetical protein
MQAVAPRYWEGPAALTLPRLLRQWCNAGVRTGRGRWHSLRSSSCERTLPLLPPPQPVRWWATQPQLCARQPSCCPHAAPCSAIPRRTTPTSACRSPQPGANRRHQPSPYPRTHGGWGIPGRGRRGGALTGLKAAQRRRRRWRRRRSHNPLATRLTRLLPTGGLASAWPTQPITTRR